MECAPFVYDPAGLRPPEKKAMSWREGYKQWKIAREREHGRPARRLMMRAAIPDKKIFYSKLGSERIVSYSSSFDVYRFAGSSFNTQLKKIFNEREEKNKVFENATPELFERDYGNAGRESVAVPGDYSNKADQSGNARGLAGGVNRKISGVHLLSVRSKAKIRGKITEFFAWCRLAKKQCTFLTLTFISKIGDRLAAKILNKFLTSIRQEIGSGFQYIRVAERQKNGNIHFHLLLDRPINIIRFNSLWVLSQYNEGLIGISGRFGRVIHKEEIEQRHKKTMELYQDYKRARAIKDLTLQAKINEELKIYAVGKLLNPVDIKKINSPGALAGYLTKYVTKNAGEFGCLAWSCSRGVSQMFTAAMVPHSVWMESLSEINSYISKDGELIQPVPYQDPKGMSVTIKIYNRKHFDAYLREMRAVNNWILTGQINFPEVPRYTIDEYLQRVHNFSYN